MGRDRNALQKYLTSIPPTPIVYLVGRAQTSGDIKANSRRGYSAAERSSIPSACSSLRLTYRDAVHELTLSLGNAQVSPSTHMSGLREEEDTGMELTLEAHLQAVEPMADGWLMADRCYRGPVVDRRPEALAFGMPLPGGAGEALAEALAGFVGEGQ